MGPCVQRGDLGQHAQAVEEGIAALGWVAARPCLVETLTIGFGLAKCCIVAFSCRQSRPHLSNDGRLSIFCAIFFITDIVL